MGVIYGLIDPTLDTQWVRIGRGYLGQSSAYLSARNADSIYYANLTAYLYLLDGRDTLSRCRLLEDKTSKTLSDGIFNADDFRVYRTDGLWKALPGKTCVVEVLPAANIPHLRAETRIIHAEDELPGGSPGLIDITDPVGDNPLIVGGLPYFKSMIAWERSSAFTFQPYIRQHYKEIDTVTLEEKHKSFPLSLPLVKKHSKVVRLAELKKALLDHIAINHRVVRFLEEMEVGVTAIDGTLDTYMKFIEKNQENDFGIRAYTNVENGVGIFASRTKASLYPVFLNSEDKALLLSSNEICALNFARPKADGDTVLCTPGVNGVGVEQLFSLK